MIKAIIFDCFGVLVTGSLQKFIDQYIDSEDALRDVHDLNDQANAGLISYENMLREYARIANLSVEKTARVMDDNPKNTLLTEFIRKELVGKYKLGFLSNAADNWVVELLGSEDANMFDQVILSCDVKLVKPDERIYKLTAEKLGVLESECLFVDDIERYCSAAQDAGMKAIHYKNFKQFLQEFQKLVA